MIELRRKVGFKELNSSYYFIPSKDIMDVVDIAIKIFGELGLPVEMINYILQNGEVPPILMEGVNNSDEVFLKYQDFFYILKEIVSGYRIKEYIDLDRLFMSVSDFSASEEDSITKISNMFNDGKNHIKDIKEEFPILYAVSKLLSRIKLKWLQNSEDHNPTPGIINRTKLYDMIIWTSLYIEHYNKLDEPHK